MSAGDVDDRQIAGLIDSLKRLQREALLANPLLDFDRMLLVKRRPFKDGRPGDRVLPASVYETL